MWETSKKLHYCLCFYDLHFQSLLAYISLSFHPFRLPFPSFCHHLSHCRSSHSPVIVDVSGCYRVAEVGPHLEHITNKNQLACNHTRVHRSLSFLSFSFSMSFFLFIPSTITSPRSFLTQSLNPTICWGLLFSPFMALC